MNKTISVNGCIMKTNGNYNDQNLNPVNKKGLQSQRIDS